MIRIFLSFLLLASLHLSAQEGPENEGVDIDQQDPYMNPLYQKGQFLVYDCVSRHWVCTQELEFDRCKAQRHEALANYKNELPCAFFDKLDDMPKCHQEQQRLTNAAKYEQFCLHPDQIENKINF
jgi:hypothetical protein